MGLPGHLGRAYRRSRYRVAGIDFAVGRRNARLDGLLAGMGGREAALITACNPHGSRRPGAVNERSMERLRGELHRLSHHRAESGTGRWRETQFLVACPAAWAAGLARRFGQNAMLVLRRGQAPRLVALV